MIIMIIITIIIILWGLCSKVWESFPGTATFKMSVGASTLGCRPKPGYWPNICNKYTNICTTNANKQKHIDSNKFLCMFPYVFDVLFFCTCLSFLRENAYYICTQWNIQQTSNTCAKKNFCIFFACFLYAFIICFASRSWVLHVFVANSLGGNLGRYPGFGPHCVGPRTALPGWETKWDPKALIPTECFTNHQRACLLPSETPQLTWGCPLPTCGLVLLVVPAVWLPTNSLFVGTTWSYCRLPCFWLSGWARMLWLDFCGPICCWSFAPRWPWALRCNVWHWEML